MSEKGYLKRLLRWFAPSVRAPPRPESALHVEQLIAASTDQERAAWLLSCPLALLAKNAVEIRWALSKARFELGISYLAVEISALNARRNSNGFYRRPTHRLVQQLRQDMSVVARGEGG